MKRTVSFNLKIIFGVWLLALQLSGAGAQTNSPVTLEQIRHATSQARTIFTKFVQERHLSLFNEPLRSEGYLCFQKPGCVRWETTAPYKSILVSDGTGVAQFEWTDDRWKKLDLGLGDALQNVVSQIAGVMDGRYASDKNAYTVSVTNQTDELVITLVPQNETLRKMMAAIEVHLAADLKGTRRVVLHETGGDYTDIQFTDQFVNLVLPLRTFDRTAPVELDQIKALAKP